MAEEAVNKGSSDHVVDLGGSQRGLGQKESRPT
jgi:hypothetical protein